MRPDRPAGGGRLVSFVRAVTASAIVSSTWALGGSPAAASFVACGSVLVVASVTLLAPRPAAAAPSDPATVENILAGIATGGAREARFSEQKFLKVLDAPLRSSGRLAYKPPGRLERITEKPKPETLVLDGDTLSMTRDGRTRRIAVSQLPDVGALVGSLRDVLAGDGGALQRRFKPIAQGTSGGWQLVLLPSDPELARLVTRIVVAGRESRIETIEILQADGDRTVTTLEGS